MIDRIDTTNISNNAALQQPDGSTDKPKSGKLREGVSVFAAYCAGKAVQSAYITTLGNALNNKIANIGAESAKFNDLYREAGYAAFNKSGLKAKGVSLPSLDVLQKIYNYEASRIPLKIFSAKRKQMQYCSTLQRVIEGSTGLYDGKYKSVCANMEKFPSVAFHGMGQALNRSTLGLGKLLVMLRPAARLLPAILLIAAIRKPKQEGETSETRIGRGLDFVKRNCVGLSALAVAPILLEEGLATLKGIHLAKGLLKGDAMKNMVKVCGAGWLTYLGYMGSLVLSVFAADKVRNWTAKKD